jgi:hypothetical protein
MTLDVARAAYALVEKAIDKRPAWITPTKRGIIEFSSLFVVFGVLRHSCEWHHEGVTYCIFQYVFDKVFEERLHLTYRMLLGKVVLGSDQVL